MTFHLNRVLSACAAAIALGTATVPVVTMALPAAAQTPTTQPVKPERNRLNLTEQQKQQIKTIRENEWKQIKGVLTPDQLRQLEQERASGEKLRKVMRSLNLTAQQKESIKKIHQQSEQQIKALLTPEQLQQWESRKNQRRPNR